MKNQIKTTKKILTRVLLGVLLLALLGGVLTSCGARGGTKITTVTKGTVDMTGDGHGLTEQEMSALIDLILTKENAATIRTQLVAAKRGYDMTAANFDDSKVDTAELTAQPDKAVEFAKNSLNRAGIGDSFYANMTAEDLETLIKCFQTTVEIQAERGVLDTILFWIGQGFTWLIKYPGFGSFILGTVYFAIALEILMIPLGLRQQKNSIKQAKLRPREMAIRNKYKGRNDQQTQQKVTKEIQELYSQEGYSPMSGCLPLLITLPFLMFLYYIVIDPLTYIVGASNGLSSAFLTFADAPRAAGGLGLTLGSSRGTIEVLSLIGEGDIAKLATFEFFSNSDACFHELKDMAAQLPSFKLFGLNMGLTPGFDNPILLAMPVLTFVAYWGTGKLTRKFTFQPMQADGQKDPAQGCSNGMMNIMMPAMSAWFTFMVPAAVGLYWIFKSILGVGKQYLISKIMPLPVFTEEDYKAAERELMGKEKNKPVKRDPNAPRDSSIRSLHHIDDEDYESPAEREARLAARKRDYEEPDEEPDAPKAEGAYSDGVTLKEDDRPARKEKTKNSDSAADSESNDD